MSLEQAITIRRSRRQFLPKPLTIEQIGQLAWAAQGQDVGSRYRTTPSAGATYPLELFVINDKGMFHYLHDKHSLEKLTDRDLRAPLTSAAWGQEFIQAAPLTLVFAAQFNRTTGRYGKRGIRYVYMEAGHAAQNIGLQAVALDLASVVIGAFVDGDVHRLLQLAPDETPLYLIAVGKPP